MSDLLNERAKTHGSYITVSYISQEFKNIALGSPNWFKLPPAQKESIDLIFTKLSRILSGNWAHADHWEDIEGYARLAQQSLAIMEAMNDERLNETKTDGSGSGKLNPKKKV